MSPLSKQYGHALDRMYDLFKIGIERESVIYKALGQAKDDMQKVIDCPGANDEIKQICNRCIDELQQTLESKHGL